MVPLSASLILLGAAAGHLVSQDEAHDGYEWVFGGGAAAALVSLALLGWTHASLDAPGSALINRHIRLCGRLAGALVCALIPLRPHLSSTTLMGSVAGVLTFLYFFERASFAPKPH